ncbi:MAG: hypothetical protein Tsb009_10820 [Planctomycetaceae bacterium]
MRFAWLSRDNKGKFCPDVPALLCEALSTEHIDPGLASGSAVAAVTTGLQNLIRLLRQAFRFVGLKGWADQQSEK